MVPARRGEFGRPVRGDGGVRLLADARRRPRRLQRAGRRQPRPFALLDLERALPVSASRGHDGHCQRSPPPCAARPIRTRHAGQLTVTSSTCPHAPHTQIGAPESCCCHIVRRHRGQPDVAMPWLPRMGGSGVLST
ncbi:hypothetical protein NKH77_19970 [Streptomyces sp. M19]